MESKSLALNEVGNIEVSASEQEYIIQLELERELDQAKDTHLRHEALQKQSELQYSQIEQFKWFGAAVAGSAI